MKSIKLLLCGSLCLFTLATLANTGCSKKSTGNNADACAAGSCDGDETEEEKVETVEEEEEEEREEEGLCSTQADCSYNGECISGNCECAEPWTGSECNKLTLGTVEKSVYGYREGFPYTTSWGASAQYDETSEQYLMLVSEYVEECANWGWNSTVALATSESAQGPYEKQFTLFGVMSHEAMLARAPTGEWVVYFTASEQENGLPRAGDAGYEEEEVCRRSSYDQPCECPGDPDKGSKDPTWMSYTKTPLDYASWSTPEKIFDPGNDFTDLFPKGDKAESIDANFNGVINADGSFVGLWRTWQCTEDLFPPWTDTLAGADEACFSVPHAVNALDWREPSTYEFEAQKRDLQWLFEEQYYVNPTPRLALGIEDPMVYVDSRAPEVYHAIFHEMFVPYDTVAHAYSEDGISWTYTGPVFETDADTNMPMVRFTDGSQAGLACERPQLLVEEGVPTHIIIGGIPTGLNDDPEFPSGYGELDSAAEEFGWPGGATLVIPLD